MSTIFSELISSRNLFFKGESLSNFTSSVRRPTHRKKMDEDGETGIELVGTKVRLLQESFIFNRLFLPRKDENFIKFGLYYQIFHINMYPPWLFMR